MEVSELVLWIARLLVLILMYAFLLALVLALLADVRAARAVTPPPVTTSPAPAPLPTVSQLEVLAGTQPVTGRKYALFDPLEIGRGPTCDISIPNRFVSTHHARIFAYDGHWMLQDLGSTNGTLVNGEAVDAPCALQAGDQVTIGDTEFIVR